MSNLKQRAAERKLQSFVSKKLDLINAVNFDHERIDPYTARVFQAVLYCLDKKNGKCFPSHEYLVVLAGGSIRSVQRALHTLRQCGYIDWRTVWIAEHKTVCHYQFNPAAAAPVLAAVKRKRERWKERKQMLRREAEEQAFSHEALYDAAF